jgi:hypothetical protein
VVAVAQLKSTDISSMNPRRDYRTYTDWALNAFIRRFPSHPDHSLAVSEAERRLKDREQNREAKDSQPDDGMLLPGSATPAWAKVALIVAGIVFGLAVLYLVFQFFS